MKKSKFNLFLLSGVAAVAIFPAIGVMADTSALVEATSVNLALDTSAAEPVAGETQQIAEAADDQQLAAAQASGRGLETVVVTARRTAENIQDVPLSIQAISGETLELKGTIDLQNIIYQTPGLNSTGGNPRNFSVLIRGIGYAPTAADGLDNAIGVYFDGVYQARPGQVLQDLVDVNSFEVLRGPQGTLFGRNAAAGALNVTSNKPSFTPSQTFEVSAGRFSFFQGKAILTGPINDKVAYRTVAFGTKQDGWLASPFKRTFAEAAEQQGISAPTATKNQATTASIGRYGVRQQFLINASDKLSIRVSGDYNRESDSSSGFSSGGGIQTLFGPGNWGINTTTAQQANVTRALTALGNLRNFGGVQNWVPSVDPNVNVSNSRNYMKTTNAGVGVTVDYDLDWASLTSITAWRTWSFNPPQDSDSSPLDIFQNMAISKSNQYSQEVRLASNNDGGPLDWQTGVFLYYQQMDDHYIIHQYGADTIAWYNAYQGSNVIPLSFRSQLTGAQIIEDTHIQNQNQAVYGQFTWHFNDKLDFTGGARYTRDRKSGGSVVDTSKLPQTGPAGVSNATLNAFYRAIDAVFVNPGLSYTTPGYFATGNASIPAARGYPLGASTKASDVSGSASLSYKFTPDVTGYVAFAKGFQAGGLDLNNGSADAAQVAVKPTDTFNYEAGIKTSLFDRHLTLSLAAYQEVLYGFQTSVSYILPNGTSYRGATNAGNIRARGFEWDATAALGGGVRVTFAGNFNDSIYQSARSLPSPAELSYNGVATIDATGQRAPFSPKWSLAITPAYDVSIGAHEEFYAYAQYSYTSQYSTGLVQSIYTQVPGQSNLNLRAGVRLQDGKYDVSFYANNALDAKNIASQGLLSAPSGAGVTAYLGRTVSYNPPALYGVTLRAKF